MEITTMQMYWLVMLDSMLCGLATILLICVLFIALGFPVLDVMGEEERFFPIAKKLLVVAAATLLLLVFTPSTKQMATIMVMPRLVNNEKVHTIGNKVYDLAVEWMEELKPNKKGSEVTK